MGVNLNLIRNFQRQSVHPVGFEPVSAELLARIVRNIVESVAPEKIILFGSYAYGNATDDSDLDILVIMDTPEKPAKRVLAVTRKLRPRPFPMDILVRTPEEIAAAVARKESFVMELLDRGVILYERV